MLTRSRYFNSISNGFRVAYIAQPNQITQLVTIKTRDNSMLDSFFTNKLKLFTVSQLQKVSSTDHYTFLAKPASPSSPARIIKKYAVHDMGDSAWRALGRWLSQKDCTPIRNASSYEFKFQLVMSKLGNAVSNFNPQRILKKHPTDRPWTINNIKLWIGKRQCTFRLHGEGSDAYRHWRSKVQGAIETAKYNYYKNKFTEVKKVNRAKRWRKIKNK